MKTDTKIVCEALGFFADDDDTSQADARQAIELASLLESREVILHSRCSGRSGDTRCIQPAGHAGPCRGGGL